MNTRQRAKKTQEKLCENRVICFTNENTLSDSIFMDSFDKFIADKK